MSYPFHKIRKIKTRRREMNGEISSTESRGYHDGCETGTQEKKGGGEKRLGKRNYRSLKQQQR